MEVKHMGVDPMMGMHVTPKKAFTHRGVLYKDNWVYCADWISEELVLVRGEQNKEGYFSRIEGKEFYFLNFFNEFNV